METILISKNIDYWEEVVKNQPASYQVWFTNEKKYLQQVIMPNSRVLDVGCGNGRSIFDVLPATQDIIGIDHDEKAISDAKNNFSHYPSVKFVQADATKMPFENESFDFVICMGTFANLADKKFDVLKEMRRVLKQSGKIVISVFSEDAFDERMKVYKSLGTKIKELRGTTVIFDWEGGDNVSEQFNEQQLRDIFSKAGMNVDEMIKAEIAYLCTLSKTP